MNGIRLPSYKSKTNQKKIEDMPLPERVLLYASQHIGCPSKVIVKRRDEVARGQIVAKVGGACSVNLHSPIAGKVVEVSLLDRPSGSLCQTVVIENTGGPQEIECLEPLKDLTPENIRQRVLDAGIEGLGGAGFPTHIKLCPPKEIKTVLLNGAECEPFLTADERIMVEDADKIVGGLEYMKISVGAQEAVICIEDDKPEAIKAMRAAAEKKENIRLEVLPKIYPQGCEKMLITKVTGLEVPSGGLPHDVGVTVHNTGTCLALYEAVVDGKPLIERVLTLSGPEVPEGRNLRVSIGTPISEILKFSQISLEGNYNLIMGGPMMGFSVDNIETGIMKTTSGILLLKPEKTTEYPCIKCGKCVIACPIRLNPQLLNKMYSVGAFEDMAGAHLADCIECGCCAYICPSGIPLTQNFKAAKRRIQ
ncbi:MAG: electron transport complex subunit RsxC [Elusimicrobia bacterium]|nr:electron transport complex subunit RsxC [Elusimicrobiota bacterium]